MEASSIPATTGLPRQKSRTSAVGPLLRLRSDEQLVKLFRQGNEDAFRAIHDRYRARLFAYTRQMLSGSRQDAEDALQDVFVRAYGALRADDREVSLRAWLYRVAHNRCIDELRRPAPPPPEVFEQIRPPAADPIAETEQKESLRRLVEDVRRLPEQQRSALLMREIVGMSYVDLAAALDVTVPAVKSLLVRARMGLAQAAEARDTACVEIREQLVDAHDRGVRASGLVRRHLHDCAGCRAYKRELKSMRERFAALGLACELVAPEPERPNLVATLPGSGGGRSLILNGHMDTVAPVRVETWSMDDPHAPERRDGKLYGLGATDMKSGLVSAWLAVAALRDAGAALAGDLQVHCVVGEEQMQHELGTSACLKAGHTADAAIVLEPASTPTPLTPSTTSAGNWVFRVAVKGRATHAGNRAAAVRPGGAGGAIGANAVEKGILIVQALQQLEAEWGQTRAHPAFTPGFFTINPGAFHADAGAPSPAYLADRAELDVLAWYPPDEDPETVKAELIERIETAARLDPWLREHPPEIEWLGNWPAAATPWEAPVARAVRAAHEQVTGDHVADPGPANPCGFPAVTDASFLEAAGVPAVVYGPGDLRVAHAADEHVSLDEVATAAEVVALTALEWCGEETR